MIPRVHPEGVLNEKIWRFPLAISPIEILHIHITYMDNTYIVTKEQMKALRMMFDTFPWESYDPDQPWWEDKSLGIEMHHVFMIKSDGSFNMTLRFTKSELVVPITIREGDNWMDIEGRITRKDLPSVRGILRMIYEEWEIRQKQILAARKPGSSAGAFHTHNLTLS